MSSRLSRRDVQRILAFAALFFFAAYLSRFFSLGFSHDSLQIDQSTGLQFQLSLGRHHSLCHYEDEWRVPHFPDISYGGIYTRSERQIHGAWHFPLW